MSAHLLLRSSRKCIGTSIRQRLFHSTCTRRNQQQQQKSVAGRIVDSWNKTEVKWYPIPVALGLTVIGVIQYRHIKEREEREVTEKPKYKATGPWQVRSLLEGL
ncbi:unnamed protein product [Rhizopus stolonifer]